MCKLSSQKVMVGVMKSCKEIHPGGPLEQTTTIANDSLL